MFGGFSADGNVVGSGGVPRPSTRPAGREGNRAAGIKERLAPDQSAHRVTFVGASDAVTRGCPGYAGGTVGGLGDGSTVAVVVLLRRAVASAGSTGGAGLLGSRVAIKGLATHNIGGCGGTSQTEAACLLSAIAVKKGFSAQYVGAGDGAVWFPGGGGFDAVPAGTPTWGVAVAPIAAGL